jgi:Phosphatidylinositol 3- and 4-kinase
MLLLLPPDLLRLIILLLQIHPGESEEKRGEEDGGEREAETRESVLLALSWTCAAFRALVWAEFPHIRTRIALHGWRRFRESQNAQRLSGRSNLSQVDDVAGGAILLKEQLRAFCGDFVVDAVMFPKTTITPFHFLLIEAEGLSELRSASESTDLRDTEQVKSEESLLAALFSAGADTSGDARLRVVRWVDSHADNDANDVNGVDNADNSLRSLQSLRKLFRCVLHVTANDLPPETVAKLPRELRRLACLYGRTNTDSDDTDHPEQQNPYHEDDIAEVRMLEQLLDIQSAVRDLQSWKTPVCNELLQSSLAAIIGDDGVFMGGATRRLALNADGCTVHDSKHRSLLMERRDGTRFALHSTDDNDTLEPKALEPTACTLQLMLAEIWRSAGLPLYPVVSEAETVCAGRGIVVEHVPGRVETMASLCKGLRNQAMLFREDCIVECFDSDEFDPELFCGSLAAMLIFSRVFALRDRHNDNIHVALPRGQVFSSDHFNFFGIHRRLKFGIKRERPVFPFDVKLVAVLKKHGLYGSLATRVADGIFALQPHIHELAVVLICMLPEFDPETVPLFTRNLSLDLTRQQLRDEVRRQLAEGAEFMSRSSFSGMIHIMAHNN